MFSNASGAAGDIAARAHAFFIHPESGLYSAFRSPVEAALRCVRWQKADLKKALKEGLGRFGFSVTAH